MQVPNWEIPTSLLKDYLASTQRRDDLPILDSVLLKPPLDEVVDDDTLGELGHTKWIKTPIDRVPPLESVICRDEHGVFFAWKREIVTY